jgi:phenylpropionate dioxygenase-like ring-hydroxylating dioxygenase large terminal subunit
MGDLMRQFWIPALRSDELTTPDGPPLRLRLLGEDLIAFRTTSGAVGLIQNACPHRGASLFFGRNEEDGLRCVYHGWKFDAGGACIDMPSEPAESNFKSKVRARAYPCLERNGVVWAYMGPRSEPPGLPELEANMLDGGGYEIQTMFRDCNYMQALEGDIDTVHSEYLHSGSMDYRQYPKGSGMYYRMRTAGPRYAVTDTDAGTTYGAYKQAEENLVYWRIAHFLFPFYTMIPSGVLGLQVLVRAWVPLDDEHCMFWSIVKRDGGPRISQGMQIDPKSGETERGFRRLGQEFLHQSSDWLGRWRLASNAGNDYDIDRGAQARNDSYTGIDNGFAFLQDQAVTESMGQIYTRDREHLGTSDAMIIRTRRRLINAARAYQERGELPAGVDDPSVYARRSGWTLLPNESDWLAGTEHLRRAFVQHPVEALPAQ